MNNNGDYDIEARETTIRNNHEPRIVIRDILKDTSLQNVESNNGTLSQMNANFYNYHFFSSILNQYQSIMCFI